jgi:hypothetical protein
LLLASSFSWLTAISERKKGRAAIVVAVAAIVDEKASHIQDFIPTWYLLGITIGIGLMQSLFRDAECSFHIENSSKHSVPSLFVSHRFALCTPLLHLMHRTVRADAIYVNKIMQAFLLCINVIFPLYILFMRSVCTIFNYVEDTHVRQ